MDLKQFKQLPIMGILRGIEPQSVDPLVETMVSAGLKTVEITMNTASAPQLIRQMTKRAKKRLAIGAGTVLNLDGLKRALDAGATFIVSPVLVLEVVESCRKSNIPVFPGALSPQEIYNAWQSGASMVKVFPAKFFGPEYFNQIKAPLPEIELLACGGVRPDNIKEFFSAGASAVAFGASVFKPKWLENKEFSRIEEKIKELIDNIAGGSHA